MALTHNEGDISLTKKALIVGGVAGGASEEFLWTQLKTISVNLNYNYLMNKYLKLLMNWNR